MKRKTFSWPFHVFGEGGSVSGLLTPGDQFESKATHDKLCNELFCLSASASWMIPDMSLIPDGEERVSSLLSNL